MLIISVWIKVNKNKTLLTLKRCPPLGFYTCPSYLLSTIQCVRLSAWKTAQAISNTNSFSLGNRGRHTTVAVPHVDRDLPC